MVLPQKGPLGKVNGFQLLKFLGKGTFGAVYQARREADGKIYAIKKVDTRRMSTKERAEAVNEIRVLASVSGEHVITFYEAFVEADVLYIVTVSAHCTHHHLVPTFLCPDAARSRPNPAPAYSIANPPPPPLPIRSLP